MYYDRDEQKRIIAALILVIILLFLYAKNVSAEETTTIPTSDYEAMVGYLKNFKALDEALPELEVGELVVFRDKVGRYYFKEEVDLKIKLGYKEYSTKLKLNTRVEKFKRKRRIISNRLKGGLLFDLEYGVLLGLDYEFIELFRFTLNGFGTTKTVGVAVGYAVSNNTSVIVGLGTRWNNILKGLAGMTTINVGVVLAF